jgi:hypothetical protein
MSSVGLHQIPHADESADDGDTHLHGVMTAKDRRQHDNPVLGEHERRAPQLSSSRMDWRWYHVRQSDGVTLGGICIADGRLPYPFE